MPDAPLPAGEQVLIAVFAPLVALILAGSAGVGLGLLLRLVRTGAARTLLTLVPARTLALMAVVYFLNSLYWESFAREFGFERKTEVWGVAVLTLLPLAFVFLCSRTAVLPERETIFSRIVTGARDFLLLATILAGVVDLFYGYGALWHHAMQARAVTYDARAMDSSLLLGVALFLPFDIGLGALRAVCWRKAALPS